MLQLKGTTIQICKYHITATKDDDIISEHVTEGEKDGVIEKYKDLGYVVAVEELDVSSELWLDGKHCETIQQAKQWLELGYIPETETDRLKRELTETQLALTEIYEMMVGGIDG